MRTVLHYSARCENADTRSLINEEATAQGADELAKDSVSNGKKSFVCYCYYINVHFDGLDNIVSNEMIYT